MNLNLHWFLLNLYSFIFLWNDRRLCRNKSKISVKITCWSSSTACHEDTCLLWQCTLSGLLLRRFWIPLVQILRPVGFVTMFVDLMPNKNLEYISLNSNCFVALGQDNCPIRVLFSMHFCCRNRLDLPFCWNCNLYPSEVLALFQTYNIVQSLDNVRPRIRRNFPCGICCLLVCRSDIGSRTLPFWLPNWCGSANVCRTSQIGFDKRSCRFSERWSWRVPGKTARISIVPADHQREPLWVRFPHWMIERPTVSRAIRWRSWSTYWSVRVPADENKHRYWIQRTMPGYEIKYSYTTKNCVDWFTVLKILDDSNKTTLGVWIKKINKSSKIY